MKKLDLILIESSEIEAITIAEYLNASNDFDFSITHLLTIEDTYKHLSKNAAVDLILVDLFLPDSFGIHTFQQLFQKYPHLPFLVFTDQNDSQIGVHAVKLGAQDYLLKEEINASILNRSITYAIERKESEKELRRSEEKYRELFVRSKDAIYMSTVDGDFVDINPAGLALFDYSMDDLNHLKVADLYLNREDRNKLKLELEKKGEVSDYEVTLKKKDQTTEVVCLLSSIVIYNDKNEAIGYQGIIKDITERKATQEALMRSLQDLDMANKELSHLNSTLEAKVEDRTKQLVLEKELVESQHKEITESIQYAKRIQASILPPISKIKEQFKNSFIYYQPKDVVSGDFYWFQTVKNKPMLAVVDCTGHGVPGAFMSIIGYTQLNEIVSDQKISDPGVILKELDKRVRIALNQNSIGERSSKDGMEMGIITINLETKKLEYSGAMRPLYLISGNDMRIIRGDRFSIGGVSNKRKEFTTTRVNIEKGDCFYLFSDGYPDQFGGSQGKKFMTRRVGEMLKGIAHLDMLEQSLIVKNTIKQWMKNEEQVDDILMVGNKF